MWVSTVSRSMIQGFFVELGPFSLVVLSVPRLWKDTQVVGGHGSDSVILCKLATVT